MLIGLFFSLIVNVEILHGYDEMLIGNPHGTVKHTL